MTWPSTREDEEVWLDAETNGLNLILFSHGNTSLSLSNLEAAADEAAATVKQEEQRAELQDSGIPVEVCLDG